MLGQVPLPALDGQRILLFVVQFESIHGGGPDLLSRQIRPFLLHIHRAYPCPSQ